MIDDTYVRYDIGYMIDLQMQRGELTAVGLPCVPAMLNACHHSDVDSIRLSITWVHAGSELFDCVGKLAIRERW